MSVQVWRARTGYCSSVAATMTNKSYASEVVHSPSREETPSIQSADTDSQTQREKTFHDNTLESSKLAPQAGTLDAKNGAQGPKGPPAGPGMGFPQVEFPTGIKLYSNIISLYLAGFLTALVSSSDSQTAITIAD